MSVFVRRFMLSVVLLASMIVLPSQAWASNLIGNTATTQARQAMQTANFAVKATASPFEVVQGQNAAMTIEVTGLTVRRVSANTTVFTVDATSRQVRTQEWENVTFQKNKTVIFKDSFALATDATIGQYTLRVRITSADGKTVYFDNANMPSFNVKASNVLQTTGPIYGVLQSQSAYLASSWDAGIRVRSLEIGWDAYEPQEGAWNQAYVEQKRTEYQTATAAGYKVVLDLGLQYPPSWIFTYPNSRFVNQYGDTYVGGGGQNGVNAIFSQTMRDKQARFVQRALADLGTDFYAIRLGWGYYGELNYPATTYNGRGNSYWAYDALAQGRTPGLPAGMQPSPVPGWVPGTASSNHAAASAFLNWYMNSLKNYHDWQITTVRSAYSGTLLMLYPSWGVRPGQLDAAIAVDLNGTTSPEINGEIQRGFDFARFIAGITDPGVAVYTTWLDATSSGESTTDQTRWTPVHYLASLAAAHPLRLKVWGENAGRNSALQMQHSVAQARTYRLSGVLWAFEPDLYSGQYATVGEFATAIQQ